MNYPFNVEFIIFDKKEEVSQEQEEIRTQLIWDDLRDIVKEIFNDDNHYKWLDRVEASVSSTDETKQLRLAMDSFHTDMKQFQHSIIFNQNHYSSTEYFTIEELKYISGKIKNGLEEFLRYEINDPIIYIETKWI